MQIGQFWGLRIQRKGIIYADSQIYLQNALKDLSLSLGQSPVWFFNEVKVDDIINA